MLWLFKVYTLITGWYSILHWFSCHFQVMLWEKQCTPCCAGNGKIHKGAVIATNVKIIIQLMLIVSSLSEVYTRWILHMRQWKHAVVICVRFTPCPPLLRGWWAFVNGDPLWYSHPPTHSHVVNPLLWVLPRLGWLNIDYRKKKKDSGWKYLQSL